MKRTVRLKLHPTPEQAMALCETQTMVRYCFDTVAAYGWEQGVKNGVALHKATYYPLREKYPSVPAQLVCAARVKATEALASAFALKAKGLKVHCPRTKIGSIRYDARSHRILPGEASLASAVGRIKVAWTTNSHAAAILAKAVDFDSSDLLYRDGTWWLHAVLTLPDEPFSATGKAVGVDLGINRPAVTSGNEFLGEARWKEIEKRYFRLKRNLQAKGTASAKRHLQRVRHLQQRFRRDCDHVLSRRIVDMAGNGSVIVLENLKGIRSTTKQRGKRQRRRHHGWSYEQLKTFLEYKAEAAGCRVETVDPRKTSQRCSKCEYTARSNRKNQSLFVCGACGFSLNADLNAARNIAWKYLAQDGMPALSGPLVNRPIVTHVEAKASTGELRPSVVTSLVF